MAYGMMDSWLSFAKRCNFNEEEIKTIELYWGLNGNRRRQKMKTPWRMITKELKKDPCDHTSIRMTYQHRLEKTMVLALMCYFREMELNKNQEPDMQ